MPKQEFLQNLNDFFTEGRLISPITISDINKHVDFCVLNIFFQFENNFHKQFFYASLGNSFILIVSCLDKNLFDTIVLLSVHILIPALLFSFVDDVFALIQFKVINHDTLALINSLSSTIQFPLKVEMNKNHPFSGRFGPYQSSELYF